ncbi:MAG: EAL domain-containing protein [Deferribacterales bacterium]
MAVQIISSAAFTIYYLRQKNKNADSAKKLAAANVKIQQYLNAVDASNMMCISSSDGIMKYINKSYLDVVGFSFDEIVGNRFETLAHPDTDMGVYEKLFETLQQGNIWSGTMLNKTKKGGTVYLETSVVPIKDENGKVIEYLSIRKDITPLINQQDQIKKQYTDPLTGFPNRTKMRRDLEEIENPALAIINIDGFSTINAYYGLETGDEVLVKFANLVRSKIPNTMTTYRLSGDEFAIVAGSVTDIDDFNQFMRNMLHEITETTFFSHDNEMMLNLTAGTAIGGDNLLIKAGMAIKHARLNKKNLMTYSDVQIFTEKLKDTVQYSTALRTAVKESRVVPHFQPIADAKKGTVYKYEALMRIQDDKGGFLPPLCFLELSKQLKLYNGLSSLMVQKSIEKIIDNDIHITINFDKEDVVSKKIHNILFTLIRKHNLQGRITIEITESEGMDNLSELAAFISSAKNEGCLIAIDDFGTGYSNFMYILSLQPDYLKIDGSITRQILESSRARLLTETIVSMCRRANIKTIAEFVSSEEIYQAVKEIGVDYVQGYHFGKPEQHFQ